MRFVRFAAMLLPFWRKNICSNYTKGWEVLSSSPGPPLPLTKGTALHPPVETRGLSPSDFCKYCFTSRAVCAVLTFTTSFSRGATFLQRIQQTSGEESE